MDIHAPAALLGGLSPAEFVRRHWQRRPLLVRQAIPGVKPPLHRRGLFALAQQDDVPSRLVLRDPVIAAKRAADRATDRAAAPASDTAAAWRLQHGPFARRDLPPLAQPGWTLLVQELDLHVPAARVLLDRFRFLPDARLDDLMASYATDGGGVGPHSDSYDVFLLQVAGRRRWRVGRVRDATLVDGAPLKLLARFEPQHEYLLEPGDMLYVPPRWGHDGIAQGECITCSIGYRAPARIGLGIDLLHRIAEAAEPPEDDALYRDAGTAATDTPGAIPPALQAFAADAMARLLAQPHALAQALGERLSEPASNVVFDRGRALRRGGALHLDHRTRMLYDRLHVYINGEALRAGGHDAKLMRELADRRRLDAHRVSQASPAAREWLAQWAQQGWLHAGRAEGDESDG
jgi:50S ribosomal protein L16 3-hydroxylase